MKSDTVSFRILSFFQFQISTPVLTINTLTSFSLIQQLPRINFYTPRQIKTQVKSSKILKKMFLHVQAISGSVKVTWSKKSFVLWSKFNFPIYDLCPVRNVKKIVKMTQVRLIRLKCFQLCWICYLLLFSAAIQRCQINNIVQFIYLDGLCQTW